MHLRGPVLHRHGWSIAPPVVLLIGGIGMAVAEGAPPQPTHQAVVELFTSQGCPKCPPADRLIADFAKRPGVIALSFAVGTWDYIGWKDTLAEPAFSARQRGYAAARGDKLLFTPQAIIDGIGVQPGADKDAILHDIEVLPAHDPAMGVPMTLSESDGRLHIDVGSGPAGAAGASIYILRVAREKTVEIDRGENSGRTETYTNVVRAMNRVGGWTGDPQKLEVLELKGAGEGYVVLLQGGTPDRPGPILAAAKTADL